MKLNVIPIYRRWQENGNQAGPRASEQGVRTGGMESRGGQIAGESAGDKGEDGGDVPAGIGDEATARWSHLAACLFVYF